MNYFTDSQIGQVEELAVSILENVGIRVKRADCRARLRASFAVRDEYVTIPPAAVRRYLADQRAVAATPPVVSVSPTAARDVRFSTFASAYSHSWLTTNDSVLPLTYEQLERLTWFTLHVAAENPTLIATAPGHAGEGPAHLQFLDQVKTSFQWCPGFRPMEAENPLTAPYYYDMCDAMGVTGLTAPVYMASPMLLAGDSFDIAIDNAARLTGITVTCMPALGANTPLSVIGAYAQTVAETVGGAILVGELTGLPVQFRPTLFPYDMREMSMPFGTPEKLVLEWMNLEVLSRLLGRPVATASTDIHTNAVHPGAQASMEKGSLAMAGAMRGETFFFCSGTLAMDEVFSPVQLLLDLETLEHVRRSMIGLPVEDWQGDIVSEILAGMQSGYVSADRTLDNYSEFAWYPRLMNRGSLMRFMAGGSRGSEARARELAADLLTQGRGQLERVDGADEIERIYDEAASVTTRQ